MAIRLLVRELSATQQACCSSDHRVLPPKPHYRMPPPSFRAVLPPIFMRDGRAVLSRSRPDGGGKQEKGRHYFLVVCQVQGGDHVFFFSERR